MVFLYVNLNPPQIYTCSPYQIPHPPTSLYHPSGSSLCTSILQPVPSNQYPASNLDWLFVSYMILYMFQCHSPKSSHPLPLPQSPKDCSIHQCLFCCLAYRVIVTIFLNSMYMHYCIIIPCIHMHTYICILYWCFTFWLTSLCIIGSSSIHFIRTDSNVLFLMAE